jgi:hypothetical protein
MTLPLASIPAAGDNSNALATTAFVKAQGYLTALGNAEAVLAADFAIAANATYVDTGLAATLPAAGTYLLIGSLRTAIQASGGESWMNAQLSSDATGAAVADTLRLIAYVPAGETVLRQSHVAYVWRVVATGPDTIRVLVKREGGPTWTYALILSNVDGRSTLDSVRLA